MLTEVDKHLIQELDTLELKIRELKELENSFERLKEELYSHMIDNDITSFDTNNLSFTLVRPSLPKTEIVIELDADKLKQEEPLIYHKYLTTKDKVTNGKKGYLRMTIKREER